MFRMLDFDADGYLHASDIVEAQQFIDELSDFGEELTKLAQYYIDVYLESGGEFKFSDMINMHKYKDLLDDSANKPKEEKKQRKDGEPEVDEFIKFRSKAIDEIKMKVMGEPEQYKESSVFVASKAQIEKAKQRERMLRSLAYQQNLEKQKQQAEQEGGDIPAVKRLKAILTKENKIRDPFRVKKSVQFMIALSGSDDDEEGKEGQGLNSQQIEEALNVDTGDQEAANSHFEKKTKILVVNATDEIEDFVERRSKKSQLSKEQRNS